MFVFTVLNWSDIWFANKSQFLPLKFFVKQKFFILMKSNISTFPCRIVLWGWRLRTCCLVQDPEDFFMILFLKFLHISSWYSCVDFCIRFTFYVKVHFLPLGVQLLPYHLLKRLSFLHWIAFVTLSKSIVHIPYHLVYSCFIVSLQSNSVSLPTFSSKLI